MVSRLVKVGEIDVWSLQGAGVLNARAVEDGVVLEHDVPGLVWFPVQLAEPLVLLDYSVPRTPAAELRPERAAEVG